MAPPTYRERLRVEGFTLAACGALGALLLLVLTEEAAQAPVSTVVQLVVVAGLLVFLGSRATRKALRAARGAPPEALGSGEPTPLWQLPLIVAGLTAVASALGGWEAGLRVTAGCVLVGLFQAVLVERWVARAEAADGRSYHRVAGSRLGRGTNLGYAETAHGIAS